MAARNILNVAAVDDFIASLGELAEHEAVVEWLKGTARRHVLRNHDRFFRVERERASGAIVLRDPDDQDGFDLRPFDGELPAWCEESLGRGDEVVFLRLDGGLAKTVRRTIEYLDDFLDESPKRRIQRLGFPQAVKRARQARHERMAGRASRLELGAIPVYHYGRSARVVQLTTPSTLALEGDRMNHCVAEYSDALRLEECEIYSLRDALNEPQATIEVDPDGRVIQVKGKANGPVAAAFRPAVRSFIAARGYELIDDFWNVSDTANAILESGENLETVLTSPEGQHLLRRYRFAGGAEFDIERQALTQLIFRAAFGMTRDAMRVVFTALSPGRGAPVRLRERAGLWVYDRPIAQVQVDVPLMLVNLVRDGAFVDADFNDEGRGVLRAVENILPTLVYRELDRVYLLGRTRTEPLDWRQIDWKSTADFLLDCPYDIRAQRADRHRALLEGLNRAKRRAGGRRAPASDAHVAMRRLLTGAAGIYAI